MVEPLLDGIVLGLIAATILGLLVDAYFQYQRTEKLLKKNKVQNQK
ncbi:cytochrome b6-f complex subunit PetG [filamentous cyanobacterium CCP2]|nr:cytochrome b6-f complex subunit PetG [filamentous cyanobacterium CCP2]